MLPSSSEVTVGASRNPFAHRVIRAVSPLAWLLFRLSVQGVENLPRRGGFLLAGNHISSFDSVPLYYLCDHLGFTPCTLAKATLFDKPLVGPFIRAMQAKPVARGTNRAKEAVQVASRLLDEGEVVVIFPEGTTSRQQDYWPMTGKTGVARIALQTGIPVIPFAQWGTQRVQPRYSLIPRLGFRHLVKYRFGPPVNLSEFVGQAEDHDRVREATDKIMAEITSLLEDIRGEVAPDHTYDLKTDGDPFGTVPSIMLASRDRRYLRQKKRLARKRKTR